MNLLTFLPPSNCAVFDCWYFLRYWLQRDENSTSQTTQLNQPALSTFELNLYTCIWRRPPWVNWFDNVQKCKQWRQQGFACIIAAENGPSFQGVVEKYHMTCSLLLFTETFFSRKVTQKLQADNRPEIGPLLLNSCVGQNHLARERRTQGSSKTMQLHHLKSKFSFFHSPTASFAQLHCSHSPIIERFVLLAAILDECQICLGGGGRGTV